MSAANSTIPCPMPAASARRPENPAFNVEVSRILGISVPVSVALAQREMSIEAILAITPGTILEFDVPSSSELSLYVGNQSIGRGEAVKVGENFGLRLTRIGTVRDRIDAMSPPHEAGPGST